MLRSQRTTNGMTGCYTARRNKKHTATLVAQIAQWLAKDKHSEQSSITNQVAQVT